MTDTLPVTLVVPEPFESDSDKIGMLLSTAETAFQVNKWDVKFKTKVEVVKRPDFQVYDARFCSRTSLATVPVLRQRAKEITGDPRYRYVIFVCDMIVDAPNWHTDTVTLTYTNGESVPNEMISILSLIGRKSTVGNADGQTWAHEMGHGLGLGHVDNDDNFMAASRHRFDGRITGFDMTPEQIGVMGQHCRHLTQVGL